MAKNKIKKSVAAEQARTVRKMTSGKKPTPKERELIKAFFGFDPGK